MKSFLRVTQKHQSLCRRLKRAELPQLAQSVEVGELILTFRLRENITAWLWLRGLLRIGSSEIQTEARMGFFTPVVPGTHFAI